jgi:hypothetical protein
MPSLIRFVLLAVMALLMVVLAFSMIGCLPRQGAGACMGVHSDYRSLMVER